MSALLALCACGSADSSAASSAFSGGSATVGGATQSGGAGGATHSGGSSNAANILGQGGKAGSAAAAGNAGEYPGNGGATSLAPVTWNSAKSASITEAQLAIEYGMWKLAHVEACPNGSSVVVKDGAVVSEGIGYGMLLSAAMADQPLFDGLWKYYQDHLDKNGLMNWTTAQCEAPGNTNQNAATDADLDTTMALVQAAARWPSAGYLAKAQILAGKIAQFETDMCSGRRVLRPGDAFGGCSDPGDPRINPSYFAPGYYKVFAHYFPEQAATWTALADGSYQLYALYQARMGNLVPDWSGPDGSDNGSSYSWDACRTPWRVAIDYAWTGDTRAKTFMQNVSTWVDAHGGLPLAAQQQNSAFVGAFALAGGYDQGKFDGYMSAWLGAKLDDAPYYQGTLRVLYLLAAAGKFSSTL
ncbi:MAG TPA: glycosyl hydrolase family 8 [Polyangiaceae bacterium]|nr:glycosyl hydrolase family 8 [Polyangiaceae bacterium]